MRLQVIYIDLHNPLFLCGMNLGQKVYPQQKGIRWEYDMEKKLFFVKWKGQVHLLDSSIMQHCQVIDNGELFEEVQAPSSSAGMPAIARAKREQPQLSPQTIAAREASANAYKGDPAQIHTEQNLIEQNKNILAGKKADTPVKLSGKPKILSHGDIKLDPLPIIES